MATTANVDRISKISEFSDVTIKFGSNEVKCHKAILAIASDYFKPLFGSLHFVESQQAVVELKEDDPDAVMAMLRHTYGHTLEEIVEMSHHEGLSEIFITKICGVADKYMLQNLIVQGTTHLCEMLSDAQIPTEIVLGFVKILAPSKDKDASKQCDALRRRYFNDLFKLEDFRIWLVTDPAAKLFLERAISMVDYAHRKEFYWR